jgi:RNA polymerase sigma-70 factor (ECF subfamily)
LYRVARSVLLNDHEAEDVVQEKFIRAFTGLASFRGESSLSTWLTRIALNESRRRKHGRRRQFGLKVLDFSSAQRDAQIHSIPPLTKSKTRSARLARRNRSAAA